MDTPATSSAAPTRGSAGLNYLLVGVVIAVGAIFVLSGSTALPNDWYALFKAIHVGFAVIWVGGGVLLTINGIRCSSRDRSQQDRDRGSAGDLRGREDLRPTQVS
jgi:hypothetical protein